MNGNKQLNKLATQIAKKQDNLDGYIATQIVIAQKNLKAYIDAQAREEKEIAELNKQQEDIKNHKPGQLAKVSIYEFVNDWVRPEISFQILSYLGDPHREGIKKARTHRKRWNKEATWVGGRRRVGYWEDNRHYSNQETHWLRPAPYCELPLYKTIGELYYKPGRGGRGEQRRYEKMSQWYNAYAQQPSWNENTHRPALSPAKYRHTNPILHELWCFHQIRYTEKGTKKFIITKGDIKKYLTAMKVNGRTDLTYGVKCSESNGTDEIREYVGNTNIYKAPRARRELVGALMKLE